MIETEKGNIHVASVEPNAHLTVFSDCHTITIDRMHGRLTIRDAEGRADDGAQNVVIHELDPRPLGEGEQTPAASIIAEGDIHLYTPAGVDRKLIIAKNTLGNVHVTPLERVRSIHGNAELHKNLTTQLLSGTGSAGHSGQTDPPSVAPPGVLGAIHPLNSSRRGNNSGIRIA